MRQVSRSIKINSSKEEVWDVLFNQFGDVNNFNPLIEASISTKGGSGDVGSERMCTIDSKTQVYERITRSEEGQNFDIEVFEGGLPMMDKMIARLDVIELSENQTEAQFTMNYTTKPPIMGGMMKGMMGKMFFKLLIGLKYHLETGKLVTKQDIKSIEKMYRWLGENESFPVKMATAS